jgi:hypothetical protein
MAEIIKETITTQPSATTRVVATPAASSQTADQATQSQTIEYLIYFFFGALDVLLAFRLVLKLLGASMASGFVGFIYGLSGVFIMPFEGIFRKAVAQGIETTSVLEPSTIVALIVYAILAWGIVKLVRLISGERQTE